MRPKNSKKSLAKDKDFSNYIEVCFLLYFFGLFFFKSKIQDLVTKLNFVWGGGGGEGIFPFFFGGGVVIFPMRPLFNSYARMFLARRSDYVKSSSKAIRRKELLTAWKVKQNFWKMLFFLYIKGCLLEKMMKKVWGLFYLSWLGIWYKNVKNDCLKRL